MINKHNIFMISIIIFFFLVIITLIIILFKKEKYYEFSSKEDELIKKLEIAHIQNNLNITGNIKHRSNDRRYLDKKVRKGTYEIV